MNQELWVELLEVSDDCFPIHTYNIITTDKICPGDEAVEEVLRCSKTHLHLKIILTEKKKRMCPIKVRFNHIL